MDTIQNTTNNISTITNIFSDLCEAFETNNPERVSTIWTSLTSKQKVDLAFHYDSKTKLNLIHLICHFTPRGENTMDSHYFRVYFPILHWITLVHNDSSKYPPSPFGACGHTIQNMQTSLYDYGTPLGLAIVNHNNLYIRVLMSSRADVNREIIHQHSNYTVFELVKFQDPDNIRGRFMVGIISIIKDVVTKFPFNSLEIELITHPRSGLSQRWRKEYKITSEIQNMMCPVKEFSFLTSTPKEIPQWLYYELSRWTLHNNDKFKIALDHFIQEQKAS